MLLSSPRELYGLKSLGFWLGQEISKSPQVFLQCSSMSEVLGSRILGSTISYPAPFEMLDEGHGRGRAAGVGMNIH